MCHLSPAILLELPVLVGNKVHKARDVSGHHLVKLLHHLPILNNVFKVIDSLYLIPQS